MKDILVQTHIDQAREKLQQASELFKLSQFEEARECVQGVGTLLEQHIEREDLGSCLDHGSQKYTVISLLMTYYRFLGNLAKAVNEHYRCLEYYNQALAFSRSIDESRTTAELITLNADEHHFLGDYVQAKLLYSEALEIYSELSAVQEMADSLLQLGIMNCYLGQLNEAINNFVNAKGLYEGLGNERAATGAFINIGNIYGKLEQQDKALEIYTQARAVLQKLNDKEYLAIVTENIGAIYTRQGQSEQAIECFSAAYDLFEELDSKSALAGVAMSFGVTYKNLGLFDKAIHYYMSALATAEEIGDVAIQEDALGKIGALYSNPSYPDKDMVRAEQYLLRSLELCERMGDKERIYGTEELLAKLYECQERWEDFARHFKRFHLLKEEFQSAEARKQVELFEQQRQLAEQNQQLEIERTKASSNKELLHKVLPSSIADRIVQGERVADYFQNVSILFADIVGFTPIASRMPAKAVLAFLNYIFGAFDRMTIATGCEKIKTIGDGYLAVAGAPVSCEDHAERIARLAIEMSKDIILPDEISKTLPKGAQFSLRIGIHTGPCFGGIVGENRFVYDIYSDAVNLAARMESHGAPGKIHISDEFCFHLQNRMDMTGEDFGGIRFDEREEMEIKGKGMMRTYFLEKA